jgi:hypothetical protein
MQLRWQTAAMACGYDSSMSDKGRRFPMADKHICVAIYISPGQADEAFSRLQAGGSGMDQISFVGRDYWKDMVGSRKAGEPAFIRLDIQ